MYYFGRAGFGPESGLQCHLLEDGGVRVVVGQVDGHQGPPLLGVGVDLPRLRLCSWHHLRRGHLGEDWN